MCVCDIKCNTDNISGIRSELYAVETITDSDYTDNLALLTNTPVKPEYLLHHK